MTVSTIIACNKTPLDTLTYREVITIINGVNYLLNVNILLGRRIIKKIRFEPGEKPYNKGMGKEIALTYLKNTFDTIKKQEDLKTAHSNINCEAADKAAKDLFSEIDLNI